MQDALVNGIQELSVSPASPTIPTAAAQIDKLPPETLAAIFVHLSKQEPDSPGRSSSYFVEDLLSITHVCRFWRQVAINAPELWTEITMKNPKAIEAFLERSGAVSLNVGLHLGPGTEPPCGILEAVAPHSHRFRRFSIFAPPEAHYDPFAAFTGPAPLLERLEINYPVDSPPRSLFGGQTPRLRELVISACGLWLQHQFGNLTSLHIKLCDFVLPRLGFLPFFDMLRHCPVLEEMFVWWNIWDVVRETPAQLLTVPLHRLRKLLLRSFRIENIGYLLRTFEFGANRTAVHLNEVDLGRNGEDSIARIQMVFPNDNSSRPSLVFSTKLELIPHATSNHYPPRCRPRFLNQDRHAPRRLQPTRQGEFQVPRRFPFSQGALDPRVTSLGFRPRWFRTLLRVGESGPQRARLEIGAKPLPGTFPRSFGDYVVPTTFRYRLLRERVGDRPDLPSGEQQIPRRPSTREAESTLVFHPSPRPYQCLCWGSWDLGHAVEGAICALDGVARILFCKGSRVVEGLEV